MPIYCRIFVGGGFDDNVTHIVENYRKRYGDANPGVQTHYYSWKRGGTICDIIDGLAAEDHVVLVGHSFGADTAFSVVTDTARAVNGLVSIDPVGRLFNPSWTAIRAKARRWLNVRAEPTADRRTTDDTIAWIGGQYPRPPAPGQAGAPDFSIIANQTHGAFSPMMRESQAGVSGQVMLGGTRVN